VKELETAKELLHLLSKSVGQVEEGVILLSGLDSTILAYLIPNSKLYTFGLSGSRDIKTAKTRRVGERKVNSILLSDEDLIRGLKELNRYDLSLVEVSFILPFAIIGEKIGEEKLISGHGADELFGGYSKYFDEIKAKSRESVEVMMGKDLELLKEKHLPIVRELLNKNGKKLFTPYLSDEIVDLASKIPIALRLTEKKYILKRAAALLMPDASMEKKALQYSSGVMKWLKKEGETPT